MLMSIDQMLSFTNQELMVFTGEIMYVLLIVILAARPLAYYKITNKLLKYRRQLGWAFTVTSLLHVGYWVAYYYTLQVLIAGLSSPYFVFGLFAFLISSILGITSNNYSVQKLKRTWKTIHKLTYLLVPLGLLHGHYAIRGFDPTLLLWIVPMITLLLWRWRWITYASIPITGICLFYFITLTDIQLAKEQSVAVEKEHWFRSEHHYHYIGSVGRLEIYCEPIIPESASCGWPIYLKTGERIDNEQELDAHRRG